MIINGLEHEVIRDNVNTISVRRGNETGLYSKKTKQLVVPLREASQQVVYGGQSVYGKSRNYK